MEDSVWQANLDAAVGHNELALRASAYSNTADKANPQVMFSWRGPGGTFQLPVKGLMSLGVPTDRLVRGPLRCRAYFRRDHCRPLREANRYDT